VGFFQSILLQGRLMMNRRALFPCVATAGFFFAGLGFACGDLTPHPDTFISAGDGRAMTMPAQTSTGDLDAEGSEGLEDSAFAGDASASCTTCTVLAIEAINPQSLALDPNNVYWTNAGAIADGGGAGEGAGSVELVARSATSGTVGSPVVGNLTGPLIIASADGWLVWSAEGTAADMGTVSVKSTSAGKITMAGTDLTAPWGVAVDAKNAYWVSGESGGVGTVVQSAPLTTGIATVLGIAPGGYTPGGLAVNATDLFFAAWIGGGGGAIFTVPTTGGTPQTVWTTQTGHPQDVAVDSTNLYWVDEGAGALYATPLAGGNVTTLASGFTDAFHLAVDGTNVYVADEGAGTILEIPVAAGGTVRTLASGLDSPLAVAVDTSSSTPVYFTTATDIESVPK
jgi:hypothetical protein